MRSIRDRLEHLASLQRAYASVVPPALRECSRAGYLDGSTLVVTAENGAVAAKLKQQLPSLLARLQEKAPEVGAIRVRVEVAGRLAPPPERPARNLSEAGRTAFARLAQELRPCPLRSAIEALLARRSHQD